MIFFQKRGFFPLTQSSLRNSLTKRERRRLLLSLNLKAKGGGYFLLEIAIGLYRANTMLLKDIFINHFL